MEIDYELTEEDYLNFNMFHVKNSKTAMKSLAMQRFLTPIVFLILSYVLSAMGDGSFIGLFITFSITGILWIIFYPKYFYSLIKRNTKKMIKEGKNDGLLGNHHLIMNDEGLVDSTSDRETKVTWSGIKNFKEDNDNLYLYTSSISSYILPKRELNNVEEVRNYFKAKVVQ
ncbi:YcxB family protein [Sporosarcina limicola]|uniref:YcxB-like C-terminal domain-containing protein n=1 Tax=Sporosarcina limicola TaxID=34101 RepID=A0A927MJ77_9BACL|nr:YcxB family protein [Sporosarcina limicola]MBE1555385.1 hypothetical protein [Sporosarcina limicola]